MSSAYIDKQGPFMTLVPFVLPNKQNLSQLIFFCNFPVFSIQSVYAFKHLTSRTSFIGKAKWS